MADELEGVDDPGRIGRPIKPWNQLKSRQKRSLSQVAVNEVKKMAESRLVEPHVIVGGILRRYV